MRTANSNNASVRQIRSKNEPCLKHQRIIANAGSGKTYRLATRYIELLERGVPAERIVALTFTRKAAGEFLDAIFNRLVEASSSAETARTLGAETRSGGLSAAGCLAHLRQLVEKLPLLTLGTLDSFLGRILRAFSVECGLAGEVAILEDNLQTVLRRQVLAGVFREEGRSDEGFSAFLELIRKKHRNREGRNISGILDREIENLHERFSSPPAGRPGRSFDHLAAGAACPRRRKVFRLGPGVRTGGFPDLPGDGSKRSRQVGSAFPGSARALSWITHLRNAHEICLPSDQAFPRRNRPGSLFAEGSGSKGAALPRGFAPHGRGAGIRDHAGRARRPA